MALSTFRIGTPRARGEGLRIGTVRFLPRGVKKADYARRDYFDVWLPQLAPSRELFRWFTSEDWTDARGRQFFRRYRKQLLADTETRQTLLLLAALARRTDLCVGCYCEDESRCHRSELIRVLRLADAGKLK